MKIYILSGLGADKRAFQYLKLDKIPYEKIHLDWIAPLSNEPILNYCERLSEKIDYDKPFSLVGLSFGGIIAQELSKIINPQKLILISSVVSDHEFSFFIRFSSKFRIYKLLPGTFYKKANMITNYFFGAKTKEEKKLLKEIIKESDTNFVRWAINRLMNWKNTSKNNRIIRINGDQDKLFPIKRKIHYMISGGGHFMIVSKAKEISDILVNELS